MKRTNQAATMSDVAREAGVALGTVSKVINGIPVGESYRLKVEQPLHVLRKLCGSIPNRFISKRPQETNRPSVYIAVWGTIVSTVFPFAKIFTPSALRA